jgi:hypothetical protein
VGGIMADCVQVNGAIPLEKKLRLRSILALQGVTYSDWLRERVDEFLAEQGKPDEQGHSPAMAGSDG